VVFMASLGRGYLLPIAFIILIMIITQLMFVAIPGLTIYFPWAFPALLCGVAGPGAPPAEFISYIIYSLMVLAGMLATIFWWQYADQK
jgi:ABC-2 type transport system permease protein